MKKTTMITKHNLAVLLVSLTVAAAIPFFYLVKHHNKIDYKTFHTSEGWGYDIFVSEKLVIHQQYVPAKAQKKGFSLEALAKKAAESVVDKLKNNKLPTLSSAEISQICTPINN